MNDMRNLHPLATEARPTDGGAAVRLVRAWQGMDVSADAPDVQPPRSAATGAGSRPAGVAQVAGAVIVSRSGDTRIAPVLAVDFYRGAK